jgi:hypothetical protein
LRVESAIVLVLFKLLYCSTDKFMNDIIFCHTKYIVWYKKARIARSPRSGILGSNLISYSKAGIFL